VRERAQAGHPPAVPCCRRAPGTTPVSAPSPVADLAGQAALVTGAPRRTGRAIALALAQAGADVVVHYGRSHAQARAVVAEIEALGRHAWAISADLAAPDAAERLADAALAAAGRMDVLVHNVGNYPVGDALHLDTDGFRATLEANLVAAYALIRSLRAPLAAGRGSVVCLGYAGVGHVVAHPRALAYQISKTGLLVLVKSLAQALGPEGIRVNMVSPGQIENSVDLPDALPEHVPLGRSVQEEEIAAAVLYLLSPAGAAVTGVNLEMAGGYRLSLAERWRD
jgi:3-oxoacyl-[acyl-carrier protein] reductase